MIHNAFIVHGLARNNFCRKLLHPLRGGRFPSGVLATVTCAAQVHYGSTGEALQELEADASRVPLPSNKVVDLNQAGIDHEDNGQVAGFGLFQYLRPGNGFGNGLAGVGTHRWQVRTMRKRPQDSLADHMLTKTTHLVNLTVRTFCNKPRKITGLTAVVKRGRSHT